MSSTSNRGLTELGGGGLSPVKIQKEIKKQNKPSEFTNFGVETIFYLISFNEVFFHFLGFLLFFFAIFGRIAKLETTFKP